MRTNETKEVVLLLNSSQASKKLKELQEKLKDTRKIKQEAFESGDKEAYKRLTQEEKKLEAQLARLRTRAQTVQDAIRNLDKATPKQLKATISEINKQLSDGSVERGTEQWKRLVKALGEARGQLNKIRSEQNAAAEHMNQTTLSEIGQKWAGITTVMRGVAEGIQAAFETLRQYATEYVEMAEHMAGVSKYTGMSAEDVEELNEAFKRMDTRTSREALNDLAADAGRLGIQGKQAVLDFVNAADIINVALGEDLGEGAVKNIGKIAQLFGDADRVGLKQAMLATGSVINELAQTSSASEGYIMDFTARLSGMAKQAGMTQAQVMGLASVMDQSMVNSEEGATALSRYGPYPAR